MQASSPSSSSQIHRFFFFFVAFKAQAELTGVSSRFSIDCCSVNHSVTMSIRVCVWQCKLVGWLLFIFLFNGMSRSCVPSSSSSSFLPTEYSSSSSSRLVAVCSVCTQNNIREQIISSWLPKAHYNLSLRKSIQHFAICLHSSPGEEEDEVYLPVRSN